MRRAGLLLLCLLMPSLEGQAAEPLECAATLGELSAMLGDRSFPLKWEETTMGDGKPMVVSIGEKDGKIFLVFTKTREGLWAESLGAICRKGADLEISFAAEQIHLGTAASWLMKVSLVNGGKFVLTRLGTEKLWIATRGWNGVFVPVR